MDFVHITKKNIKDIKPGDIVKYHDGFGWNEYPITQRQLEVGYIMTGVHNETASLLYPMFEKMYYKKV